MADFARLPWAARGHDANSTTAYLGDEVVAPAFADRGRLEVGFHLHWALPDALTSSHAVKDADTKALSFPAAPNIWLITRRVKGADAPDRKWIVESDYFYPPLEGATTGAIAFPLLPAEQAKHGGPPFRYMGRVLAPESWPQIDTGYYTHRTIKDAPLTAIGHGDPSFAAFYPNCRSAFGFCDWHPHPPGVEVIYQVAGWFREEEDDFCAPDQVALLMSHRLARAASATEATRCTSPEGLAFSQSLGWRVTETCAALPARSIYVAELTVAPHMGDAAPQETANVSVALGNTGSEALAAFLAQLQSSDVEEVEDLLEALKLMGALDHLRIDTGAKFKETRHKSGFGAVPAGTIWQISSVKADALKADVNKAKGQITLPYPLAHALNHLNDLQREVDRTKDLIDSLRKTLFADWYKYLLSAYPPVGQGDLYPDIDAAKMLLKRHVLPAKDALEADLKTSQAARGAAIKGVNALMAATPLPKDVTLALKEIAAPRYWQPNEPVVMLTGPDVKPMDRHGQTRGLDCAVFQASAGPLHQQTDAVMGAVAAYFQHMPAGAVGKKHMTSNPWTPFLMEWQAEVWPLKNQRGATMSRDGTYTETHITAQYKLHHNAVDLTVEDGSVDTETAPSIYQGRSFLTPQAKPLLLKDLDDYFDTHLYRFFRKTHEAWPDAPEKTLSTAGIRAAFLNLTRKNRMTLRQRDEEGVQKPNPGASPAKLAAQCALWYEASGAESCDRFLLRLLSFYDQIHDEFHVLTQSLGGFNAAFLGQRLTQQLPVADPLAFPDQDGLSDYAGFAVEICDAIGTHNRVAPEPMLGFSPIRGGAMRLTGLRLIDTFGRNRYVAADRLEAASVARSMHAGSALHADGHMMLPPRVIEPVRLGFRWLAAGPTFKTRVAGAFEDIEANAHPATTPVCGWLVANDLDSSLSVYNADGKPLGYLDLNGTWRLPAGGGGCAQAEVAFHNPHLAEVVDWIAAPKDGAETILQHVLSAMGTALENVDPVDWASHEGLALLMGQPVAVVRAAIGLEMKGSPALNPGWTAYTEALRDGHDPRRHSGLIEDVNFRARLGEHAQLNDGLIGFWKELPRGSGYTLSSTFFAPQADATDDALRGDGKTVLMAPRVTDADGTKIGEEFDLNFNLKLNAPAQKVTMLFDPRARLHASVGIVPTKSIAIPPDQYTKALRDIEVAFVGAPTLTPKLEPSAGALPAIEMPLPPEPGYDWAWAEQRGAGTWQETSTIAPVTTTADLNRKSELRDGYLILRKRPPSSKDTQDHDS